MLNETVWNNLAGTAESTIRRSPYAAHADPLRQFLYHSIQLPEADISFIERAVEQLYQTRGQIRVNELAANACLSPRQFERRFKTLIGLSPKILARLIRFQAVHDHLIQHALTHPEALAHDFGYTDQAHLNHDFKALAGCSPGQFVELLIKRSQGFFGAPVPRPN